MSFASTPRKRSGKSGAESGADKAILSYYGPATCSRRNLPAPQSGGAGCNPPIWRRLHVRSDSSIATLHELLQIAFRWSDFHLLCATPLSNWNLTLSHLVAIRPPARINLASDKFVV